MAGALKDKYAIVGIGQTEFSKDSGRTTRALGVEAIRMAMEDAAGAEARVVGGALEVKVPVGRVELMVRRG